jgi:hypothetical protein
MKCCTGWCLPVGDDQDWHWQVPAGQAGKRGVREGAPVNYALIEALCVMAIAFVGRFLPESKGLSVEGVVRVFEREAAGSGTKPPA